MITKLAGLIVTHRREGGVCVTQNGIAGWGVETRTVGPEGEPPSNSVATVRVAARLGRLESPVFVRGERFK
ncbi:hypothetical protein GCM10010404_86350 [Nonomuraea africana]